MRTAIIGCGGIAENIHFKSLKEIEQVQVAAVCDIIPDRAQRAEKYFAGARSYENYKVMLEKEQLDCVLVLTQPDLLFRITLDCIRKGLHVFTEKPAGITVFQVQTLKKEAERAGKILQVGLNRRYIPLVRTVFEKVKAATEITQVTGTFNKHDTASFYDGCADSFTCDTIHATDLIRFLAGAKKAVSASTVVMRTDKNEDIDNSWNSTMRFDNGVTGVLMANYMAGGRVHTFEIHGQGASAYINLGFGGASCDAKIICYSGTPMFSISASGGAQKSPDYEYIDGREIAGSDEYHIYYGYRAELEAFFDGISGKSVPESLICDALESMLLMQTLRDSEI